MSGVKWARDTADPGIKTPSVLVGGWQGRGKLSGVKWAGDTADPGIKSPSALVGGVARGGELSGGRVVWRYS